MAIRRLAVLFSIVFACGCASPPPYGQPQSAATPPSGPVGSPFSDRRMGYGGFGAPLLLDRTDFRLGTTVEFTRFPSATELYDLHQLPGVAHVVVSLPSWPAEYGPLQVLDQTPAEADVIVILPGYPPSRQAAEAWNLVNARLRIVVVVNEAPPNIGVVDDLNKMRGLERVIAQMDQPFRSGFERLQRPLSFRKVME
jgi:hypothetical protein